MDHKTILTESNKSIVERTPSRQDWDETVPDLQGCDAELRGRSIKEVNDFSTLKTLLSGRQFMRQTAL